MTIAIGYLKGKADGSYGGKTVDAVNAFQQAMGLEATGTADNATQQRLFAESADSKAFQEWLDQHIDAGTLEAADEALSRREAEGHEADFNSIIG